VLSGVGPLTGDVGNDEPIWLGTRLARASLLSSVS